LLEILQLINLKSALATCLSLFQTHSNLSLSLSLFTFDLVLASMDLPPDKAKVLRSYDDEKKWEMIRDQEKVTAKQTPDYYLNKLRAYLDPKAGRSSKTRRMLADCNSTQLLRHLEISLRTNSIDWVRDFLSETHQGLDVLHEYLNFRLTEQRQQQQAQAQAHAQAQAAAAAAVSVATTATTSSSSCSTSNGAHQPQSNGRDSHTTNGAGSGLTNGVRNKIDDLSLASPAIGGHASAYNLSFDRSGWDSPIAGRPSPVLGTVDPINGMYSPISSSNSHSTATSPLSTNGTTTATSWQNVAATTAVNLIR
jgi:hypothetical protein